MTYPEPRYLGQGGERSAEGGIHAFRNESGEPATMLLHFAPGAPREGYFEGIADLAGMREEERAAFYLRHDNHWL